MHYSVDKDRDVNVEKFYLDIETLDLGYNRNHEKWIDYEFRERVEYKKIFDIHECSGDLGSMLEILIHKGMRMDVLDAILIDLVRNKVNSSGESFKFLSTKFLPVYGENPASRDYQPEVSFIPHIDKSRDTVIAPLLQNRHLYLAVFHSVAKKVHVYDSSWHWLTFETRVVQIKRLLISIYPDCNNKWTFYFMKKCAQQIDDKSCGIYVMYYVENILKRLPSANSKPLTESDISQRRKNIVVKLLQTTETNRDNRDKRETTKIFYKHPPTLASHKKLIDQKRNKQTTPKNKAKVVDKVFRSIRGRAGMNNSVPPSPTASTSSSIDSGYNTQKSNDTTCPSTSRKEPVRKLKRAHKPLDVPHVSIYYYHTIKLVSINNLIICT